MVSMGQVRRSACIFVFVALAAIGCPSSLGYLGWTYSLGSFAAGHSIAQTQDGGYAVFAKGRARGDTTSELQLMAVRLSADGRPEWWRLINGLYPENTYALNPVGAVVQGTNTVVVGVNGYDARKAEILLRVVQLNQQGNPVWDHTYGEAELDPQTVVATDDGGLVIAGLQAGTQSSMYEPSTFLIKIDSGGEIVWERHFDPNQNRMAVYDMAPVPSGGSILVGGGSGAQALRVDSEGNQVWWKSCGDTSAETHGVGVTPDGGFVIAGVSAKNGPKMPVVFRLDADGNVLWSAYDIGEQAASSHYLVHDALVDTEGRIVLVGEKEKVEYVGGFFPRITDEGYIMQLDSDANLNWYTSLGSCYVNGVTLTSTGDYITAGTTGSHLQVIRVRTDGTVM